MKDDIAILVEQAVKSIIANGQLPDTANYKINIDNTKDKSHGDFATNIALVLAKQAGMPPRKFAEIVVDQISASNAPGIEKLEIAGPGFINFFVSVFFKQSKKEDCCSGRWCLGAICIDCGGRTSGC